MFAHRQKCRATPLHSIMVQVVLRAHDKHEVPCTAKRAYHRTNITPISAQHALLTASLTPRCQSNAPIKVLTSEAGSKYEGKRADQNQTRRTKHTATPLGSGMSAPVIGPEAIQHGNSHNSARIGPTVAKREPKIHRQHQQAATDAHVTPFDVFDGLPPVDSAPVAEDGGYGTGAVGEAEVARGVVYRCPEADCGWRVRQRKQVRPTRRKRESGSSQAGLGYVYWPDTVVVPAIDRNCVVGSCTWREKVGTQHLHARDRVARTFHPPAGVSPALGQ